MKDVWTQVWEKWREAVGRRLSGVELWVVGTANKVGMEAATES